GHSPAAARFLREELDALLPATVGDLVALAAEAKLETLLPTGARLVVVSPRITPRLAEAVAEGRLQWRPRRYRRGDLRGASLVLAATGDARLNARLRRHAHRAGALVNAVDDPAHCDVTVPAVVRRGPVTVAITTDGHSPAAARFLREELDALLPATVGDLVALAAEARAELRRQGRYRYDYAAWRDGLLEPGRRTIADGGDRSDLERLSAAFVQEWDLPATSTLEASVRAR
ncbi:MAG: bifunctional precorrin-2 dehydrogenase/sirohydrochlorin ferrochelatase, partial [Actinomycetota bacterium]|nr:bifunctional precorrin-2 dehydrogenase/sirohydrochlorin ferrochelatase [Actinomycetota bacterium]